MKDLRKRDFTCQDLLVDAHGVLQTITMDQVMWDMWGSPNNVIPMSCSRLELGQKLQLSWCSNCFFSMQHLSSLGPSLKPKGFFYHVEPNFFHSPSFTATMASHQASAPHRRKVDIQQSSHRWGCLVSTNPLVCLKNACDLATWWRLAMPRPAALQIWCQWITHGYWRNYAKKVYKTMSKFNFFNTMSTYMQQINNSYNHICIATYEGAP